MGYVRIILKNTQNVFHFFVYLEEWYFVNKIVLTYCEKNVLVMEKNFYNSKAEGQEFEKCLRSLEQFIQTVKGQNNFW